jgi:hypothetical protein
MIHRIDVRHDDKECLYPRSDKGNKREMMECSESYREEVMAARCSQYDRTALGIGIGSGVGFDILSQPSSMRRLSGLCRFR